MGWKGGLGGIRKDLNQIRLQRVCRGYFTNILQS